MSLFHHPQETWTHATCVKLAKRRMHPGGHAGLVTSDSSPYLPAYGSQRCYNGGCIRDGQVYAGEVWPLPVIDPAFEFVNLSGWGLQLRLRTHNSMNLQPMMPSRHAQPVYVRCTRCGDGTTTAMADLNAAPGTYYCQLCAATHTTEPQA